MTIDEIKELIHVVRDTGIAELEVQRGEDRVRIRGAAAPSIDFGAPPVLPHAVGNPLPVASAGVVQLPAGPDGAYIAARSAKEEERDVVVKSPIVGTYYDAPSPDLPPFVKNGDRVETKQVLCIIESMKLMNEIEAEFSGTIIAKYVDNGRPVEYGESLFTIRPD